MKHSIPEPFKLILHIEGTNNNGFRVTKKENLTQGGDKFLFPLTWKFPKLYFIIHENKIVYVGFTADNIGSRIRTGLNPKYISKSNPAGITKTHGYSGYKWKVLKKVEMYVFVFESFEENISTETKWMFENIEAEIVYQLKSKGKWPQYQSEIHFYSDINQDGFVQKPVRSEDVFLKTEKEIAENFLKFILKL